MAVELRCPDCRAKLRLKAAPDPGTDVECPKCGTVFPAPEPEPEPEEDAPEEKAEKKPKKKKEKKGKDAAVAGPKKRKAKKRETSKAALIAVISTGVIMLVSVTGVLIWFFTRTSKSVEMMYYVPEESYDAIGMNIGHAQKYPEFYKSAGNLHTGTDYKAAGDAIAKAGGLADMDALADYMVKARPNNGDWSVVFRTKSEFDEGALAKLPGAEKKSLDGKTYYLTPPFVGTGKQRVFAPTKRLVVVAPESIKEPTFRKMINGHGEAKDGTLGMRMGDLGKRVTRGTFWRMVLYDREVKQYAAPIAPKDGGSNQGSDDPKMQWQRTVTEGLNGARGYGMKASLGSREVRLELMAWYKDSEKSSNVARKWKDSELGKGDEGEPPKWFKDRTTGMGDRKVAAQLLSNIGFGASGEVFYARSAVETLELQTSASNALSRVLDLTPGDPSGGMAPPPVGGGGGGPGGPVGLPGGAVIPGKSRVRVRPNRARR